MNFTPLFVAIFAIAQFLLNIIMANAVYIDARKLDAPDGRRGTFLVGAGLWWLATALGGLVAVAIYWAIHHSALRANRVDYN